MRDVMTTLALAAALPVSAQISLGSAPDANQFLNFAALASGAYDNVIVANGVGFAERFAGQMLTDVAGHDQLGGSPTAPLALLAGAPGRNLAVLDDGSGTVYASGVGSAGHPNLNAIGEGSIAVLFPSNQSQIFTSFYTGGGPGATLHYDFFRRNGSLIDSITLDSITDGGQDFMRNGGVKDIAGYSIWNTGGNGIVLYEFVRFDVAPAVPEPGTYALMLLGLACLAGLRGRRQETEGSSRH